MVYPFINLIPLAYDDSLSYYENMLGLINHVNTLQESLKQFQTNFEQSIDVEVEKSVTPILNEFQNGINTQINNLENELQIFENSINSDLNDYTNSVNSKIEAQNTLIAKTKLEIEQFNNNYQSQLTNLSSEILTLQETFNALESTLIAQLVQKFNDLKLEIYSQMSYQNGENIQVNNPVTGAVSSLNQALSDITSFYRSFGLTAKDYQKLNITAEEYQSLQITAYQYRYQARWVFFNRLYMKPMIDMQVAFENKIENEWSAFQNTVENMLYMFSPYTGLKSKLEAVILENFNAIHDGITATDYDEQNLTADTYDKKEITAFDYDSNGNKIL